ncbi:MAG: FprA family A-type flavoprotein [Alistipes sp.]|nr:FprA family A-type flavoprotein [Alistipes sp.]
MTDIKISDSIKYIGVDDHQIDLFEGQYRVADGVSYNSYLILDEKIALMDTVDRRKCDEWLSRLDTALAGRTPDYLVTLHMEPDHAANIAAVMERYPSMQIVGNAKTFAMTAQFFGTDFADRRVVVAEGDTLCLGSHTLQFVTAPMVHWPEVMVAYEQSEKTLFSADAFGKFGALDIEQPWEDEARRYYINIVGKYGVNVQALLKKAATLDIARICPLHGPVLESNLAYYIGKYLTWSSYEPEQKGVLIAYASIYGNTAAAACRLAEMLREGGEQNVRTMDLARCDMAEAVAEAFRYDRTVLAASTYDAGIFPVMDTFISRLKSKNWQRRRVSLIENGTWAPAAARVMCERLSHMKDITMLEPVVTVRSSLNEASEAQLKCLAEALAQ